MFKNIRKTLKLNKKKFDEIKGQRFYYSPWTTISNASLLFLFILGCIYFLITDNNLALFWILSILLSSFGLIKMFHKVIFKHPVFIIQKNLLFYTIDEKWYDLTQCKVSEEYIGKFNYSNTLKVEFDQYGNAFYENFYYIKDDDDLKKVLKKYYKKENYL